MAHYIDADTLRVKITDLCANANFHQQKAIEESDREDFVSSGGEIYAYAKVLSLLDSLQQEPLNHTELCTLIACDVIQATAKRAIEKPQDKDKEEDLMIKKMDYLNMLEKSSSTQKLPEVNLEKEVEKYLLDNADFVTKSTSNEMVNALARHFAEWGAEHLKR